MRWQIAILLCLITTVNYVDRQAFAVAGPVIVEEFSISNTEFGFIVSAFLFAYAIGHIVAGPLIDRLGTKRALGLAVIA
nr:MFS transporter [Gammaproteobacteria bacterium]